VAADPQPPLAAGSAAHALARGTLSGGQAADYATGLLLVFALLGVLMWAARWMQKRNGFGRGGMRVLSSMALGGKERLMVVDVDGERLLIGVAPGGVQLIRALGEAGEAPGPGAAAPRSWLARTLGRELVQ
jgi:flagellar protein FliO/FliZ